MKRLQSLFTDRNFKASIEHASMHMLISFHMASTPGLYLIGQAGVSHYAGVDFYIIFSIYYVIWQCHLLVPKGPGPAL